MSGNCIEAGRTVTSKVAAILQTFSEENEHSMVEIARLTGLPISTAHRLMTELTARRFLERTPKGQYRVGLTLRSIGMVDAYPQSISERAPRVLEDISASTRCRARLGVLRGVDVAYLEKVPGRTPTTSFSAAATVPAHPTAMGRALLAFSPAQTTDRTIENGLRQYTPQTVTSPTRFRHALAVIRLTRVAMTYPEFELGVFAVAMPVFGPGGRVLAAMEVDVGNLDQDVPPAVTALTIASRSLSRELNSDIRNACPVTDPVDDEPVWSA